MPTRFFLMTTGCHHNPNDEFSRTSLNTVPLYPLHLSDVGIMVAMTKTSLDPFVIYKNSSQPYNIRNEEFLSSMEEDYHRKHVSLQ